MKLHQAIDIYAQSKRELGVHFRSGSTILCRFEKQVGDIDLTRIGKSHASSFLDGSRISPSTWEDRYLVLRRFLEYWHARHHISTVALPERRLVTPSTFVPYIYTRAELRRLFDAIPSLKQGHRKVDAETLKMAILFLYATGVPTGDLIRIERKDFDFRRRELKLHSVSKDSSRQIPLNRDLCNALSAYDKKRKLKSRDVPFFRTKQGKKLAHSTVNQNFRAIRKVAKVGRAGTERLQPRLIDLKHTFAVHRIAAWLQDGVDLNRMLPALSAYLGYICLSTAERYLQLNPERFRKQLTLLSNDKRTPSWGDDEKLMMFLDSL